jgi:hypothetical protein
MKKAMNILFLKELVATYCDEVYLIYLMTEKKPVRGHQLVEILSGGKGYSSEQENLLKELRRTPLSKFELTERKSVLCDICPRNIESQHFDQRIESCNTDDPILAEKDRQVIRSFRKRFP